MKAMQIMTSLLISTLGLTGSVPVYAEQAYDEDVTEDTMIALLQEYDPESWQIVQFNKSIGEDDICNWLDQAGYEVGNLGTVVHEECHTYTFYKNDYFITDNGRPTASETIRLTDGQEFWIPYRDPDNVSFKTETYARTIPEDLRTFRYKTYVSEGSNNASNVHGIYGLLNEYSAYSWGFHNQLRMIPYYEKHQIYGDLFNNCINDYQAYAEFRYWTLGLLDYERKYAPDYYEAHMNNTEWINAYCGTTMQFRAMIRQFEAYCSTMSDDRTWKPYWQRLEEDKESRGILMLEKECASAELSAIEQELFQKCTITWQMTDASPVRSAGRILTGKHRHR